MISRNEKELISTYRDGLLEDTIPFWLRYGLDREHGGVMTCLNRDGGIIDTDKSVWAQGRFGWTMANLYNNVEPREEWIEAAASCTQFLVRNCFDEDDRLFFHVTREGYPIRKRRYAFSEAFAAMAFAAYARATGYDVFAQRARDAYACFVEHMQNPGRVPPKFEETRPMQSIGVPMIMLGMLQVLRDNIEIEGANERIDGCIGKIERYFMKPHLKAVLENAGPNGEFIDHIDGRLLNPGHALEAAWFILNEAAFRDGDSELIRIGTTILDWMWAFGWDNEYGGILYFRDVKGFPVEEYWHDMKFWWPQNEAIIATLMAYKLTGEEKYAQWHSAIHDWAYQHFPDPEYGEWYGYLHRDGRLSSPAKGTLFKGPFHLPRMQFTCWKLLEDGKS